MKYILNIITYPIRRIKFYWTYYKFKQQVKQQVNEATIPIDKVTCDSRSSTFKLKKPEYFDGKS